MSLRRALSGKTDLTVEEKLQRNKFNTATARPFADALALNASTFGTGDTSMQARKKRLALHGLR